MPSWPVIAIGAVTLGVLLGVIAVMRRDRRRLQAVAAELATREATLRLLAETVPAGIFQTDAEGRRLFVNPRLAEISGDDGAGETVARPWLVHPDDETRVRDEWAAAAARAASYRSRFRINRANDGAMRWVAVEARPHVDDAGAVSGWVGSVVDITDDTTATAELRRFSEILEATPDLVTMVDTDGCFTYANAAARARLGLAPDASLVGVRAIDVYAPGSRHRFLEEAVPTADRDGVWIGDVEILVDDGDPVPVSQVLVAHRRGDGSVDYYSSITRDLSDLLAAEERLSHATLHDALTGLPNRLVFVDALRTVMDRGRSGQPCAVLQVDVDHFKLVNDSFSHDAGDVVLRMVAERLEAAAAPGHMLARFGGDVFCLLVPEVADEGGAVTVAERLSDGMSAPFELDGEPVFLTLSIGVAVSGGDDPSRTPETMLRDADSALHRAKEKGGSRIEVFADELRRSAVLRLRTANDLHRALDNREFRVVYQPEVDVRTGHVTGVEALVRWHHPERGLVPPGEFIPLAEQTGLIGAIGEFVLDAALAQASAWSGARWDGASLAVWVNLSARQLGDPGLVTTVATLLDRHTVDASQLGLEITESALLEDAEGAVNALASLRALGVRLAVDDFGTGYSSLSYLKRLPVDAVKVDRSFVDGLSVDGDDSAIVAAVTGMARALRLTTIAEGVENLDQLLALRTLGCDLAQGYFFSTPQPASNISRLLEADGVMPLFAYGDVEVLPTQRASQG